MKKLLLSVLALVFAVGFTLAQNSSTVTQAGGNNTADVDQTLNGHNGQLTAIVDSDGNDNSVDIDQRSNTASDADFALADVKQVGDENSATIDQNRRRKANARLDQLGDVNTAEVFQGPGDDLEGYNDQRATQDGYNNTLRVVQTRNPNNLSENTGNSFEKVGVDQIGDNNFAEIIQGADNGGGVFGNEARLKQDGNDNTANMRQGGSGFPAGNANGNFQDAQQINDGHDLTTQQTGKDNEIVILQRETGRGGNTADIDQDGERNSSDVEQNSGGLAGGGLMTIDQVGNDNDIDAKQGTFGTADLDQNGNDNTIDLTQQKNGTSFASDAGTITVNQDGNANVLTANQENDVEATVNQIGSDNNVDLFQKNEASNDGLTTATIDIDGDNNAFSVSQKIGASNDVDVDIIGSDNGLTSTGAAGAISQEGAANQATLTINGSDNNFNISQTGNGNMSTNTQTGNNNTVHVTQSN